VPVEPPPSRWALPHPIRADADGLVGVGGDLEPGTLLEAYRHGLFPMPIDETDRIGWWSPDPRGVLTPDALRVTRSLRRSCRRYQLRVDSAFDDVVSACADPGRAGGWITPSMAHAYGRLHELGWAHSFEAWDDLGLAGGLYGVAIGGLFAGESMFHRRADASKVALVGLVEALCSDGSTDRLIDVQWRTEHLGSLGVVELARPQYLARLARALEQPLPACWRA
jgi:leucyl/phenylalanyl-tRNA--protein transferase